MTLVFLIGIMLQLSLKSELTAYASSDDPYKQRFLELWEELHDPSNGYFSSHGIPYHAVETLIVEAPDYGHLTTSEAMSYYLWLEALYGKFTGDFSYFMKAWETIEKYMIPTEQDQPNRSMAGYNPAKPATYAPEWEEPSMYPSQLDFSAPVGIDPIYNELVSTYGTNTIYGMHWLLDVDNWYGFGRRADRISSPAYINTFQRGSQESVWETIPQPCWDDLTIGGRNGFLDLFVGDSQYSAQFKYTNAPDADARAIQATYWANQWAKEHGVNLSQYVKKASRMGDYLRYAMFDKYFRKIGDSKQAGTGYDAAHYLLSWYYAWGGGITADWAWIIGCSHVHAGYQNPMTAWILANDPEFKPESPNGANDWAKSLERQLEFYQWLQSAEGAIAGGATNSYKGRYETLPAGISTFYGMAYEEHPVYLDPGSNTWFGFQAWTMQRVAEYYYLTGDTRAEQLLDKWVDWIKSVVRLNSDGTFEIPGNLEWSGQPDTWTGTYTGNPNLHVSVVSYGTDLGAAGSLANALLYYAKTSGDDEARNLAKELLDRMWNLYRDDKGLSAPETREDYVRFFEQEVYVPQGWSGTMPNGDRIEPGVTFLDIRSKYLNDPDYPKLQQAYNEGKAPVFNYHRFWAQCDIAIANGLYSILFGSEQANDSFITPTSATFDKNNQEDISVTVTYNGNTLLGIKSGSSYLIEGVDYIVNGDVIIIKKEFLAGQATGSISLLFDFSAGLDRTLTIDIIDTGGGEEPVEPVEPVEGVLIIQSFNANTQEISNSIMPRFRIYNSGNTSIPLSEVKLRYYYTVDGDKPQNFWCDWASIGSSNVTGTFVKMDGATTGADYYLEIGFTPQAGTLEPGASIEVQGRFSKIDWTDYTQTNDYSFNPTASSYVDFNKITAYISGNLVYGIEP
ncbi:CelY [Thermoclostridium stercorarium subsp. stercorarium DSM 8532]|nr:CelY [Thermoclostridium stercorarium subsp. stercorarium DSM 8532]